MSPDATDPKVDPSIDRALERFQDGHNPAGGWLEQEAPQRAREEVQKRDRMRKLGVVVMLLAGVVLPACPAAAQDDVDPCADLAAAVVPELPDPVPLIQEGSPGLWLPSPMARHLLCVAQTRTLDRRARILADQEVELWRKRVDILREQLSLAVEARDILAETLEAAERRAREAEESEASIWPRILWATGGGAVVAAVVGILRLVGAL